MTFILICGKANAGKTNVCNKLRDMLDSDSTFSGNWEQSKGANEEDFMAHYEKDGKRIVLNTPSDNDRCMKQFAKYLDDLATTDFRPDIIITTIRENDRNEYQMNHMCAMLGAIGNGVQRLEDHFSQYIEKKPPLSLRPLSQHAFVLHLERQQNGTEEKALTQYLDDSADKAKRMLDFAIAYL